MERKVVKSESAYVKICCNHVEDGERTFRCSVPTLLLTKSDVKTQQSPRKKRNVVKSEASFCDQTFSLSGTEHPKVRSSSLQ
jgi:hypothetical protein